ncbi:hypothetical protein HOLleu_34328 [Holothuria leucospilota]|uniref:Sulfotransferase family protein n=1 Tax=Holothuria leucospilota TaxID=206669 RepID=A0A9Q1BGL3_HOLLE|nr:hypothetical protein HOLleu_34328 [Holothuria leucospilota]
MFSRRMNGSNQGQIPRIFLWCSPRVNSTVFEKCMSFVDGVQIWHEPYMVCRQLELLTNPMLMPPYLLQKFEEAQNEVDGGKHEFHGAKLEPIDSFSQSWVRGRLEAGERDKKFIFIKDMAAGIVDNLEKLPKGVPCRHTFLIRHPHGYLNSIRKYVMNIYGYTGDPNLFDVTQDNPILHKKNPRDSIHFLWKTVCSKNMDKEPLIIDADDLINYPHKILPKYFEALGIPYDPKYLKWDSDDSVVKKWKGAMEHVLWQKRNGVTSRALASTEFVPGQSSAIPRNELSPDIDQFVDFLMVGYKEMYKKRIKPE